MFFSNAFSARCLVIVGRSDLFNQRLHLHVVRSVAFNHLEFFATLPHLGVSHHQVVVVLICQFLLLSYLVLES